MTGCVGNDGGGQDGRAGSVGNRTRGTVKGGKDVWSGGCYIGGACVGRTGSSMSGGVHGVGHSTCWSAGSRRRCRRRLALNLDYNRN